MKISNNQYWTLFMTCKFFVTMRVLPSEAQVLGITNCTNCSPYSSETELSSSLSRYTQRQQIVRTEFDDDILSDIFPSRVTETNNYRNAQQYNSLIVQRIDHLTEGVESGRSTEKSSKDLLVPYTNRNLLSATRQLTQFDPLFGQAYIQRTLWYVPLYFSVGFAIYLWALLIKSLSRHRVFYPPVIAPVVVPARANNEIEFYQQFASAMHSFLNILE